MSRKGAKKKPTEGAKTTGDSSTIKVPEVKEPFALVLYETGGKGVVPTAKIPKKSRVGGASCLVPNPIDYYLPGQEKDNKEDPERKYLAKVIMFGCK